MKVQAQRLLERLPLVTYTLRTDAPSGAVYVSPQVEELFGYAPEAFDDDGFWLQRVPEEDRAILVDGLRRLRAAGTPLDVEYRVHAADGSLRWVRDSATIDELIYGCLVDVTHEKELALELERERAALDAFFRSSAVGLAITDGEGRYVRINDSLARVNGVSPEEHVARTLAELSPAVAAVIEPLRNLSSGEPLEVTVPTRDGEPAQKLISFFPFEVQGETYHGRVVVDLTEQRRAQEAEQQYRLLLEQLPLAAYVNALDPPRAVFVSPQIEALTGYPPQAFLDDRTLGDRLIHPDDFDALKELERSESLEHEYRIVRSDGAVRWVLDRMATVRDGNGNALYQHGFLVDVTERMEAEQLLRAVWDQGLDGILVVDDAGRYVDANAAACAITGRTREELLRLTVAELVEESTVTLDEFRDLGASRGEATIVRPDGSRREVEYAARAQFLPGRHMSAIRDVTERKHLERELWRAQRLESVGRLAGGVAQDFNNLLTAIRGHAQLLQPRLGPGSVEAQHVEEIDRVADRAAALTAQLLALGQRQTLKERPLDLNRRLEELRGTLERAADGAPLAFELDPSVPAVRADTTVFGTTIEHLVTNAGEATRDGGGITIRTADVEIEGRDDLADGRYVAVAVADTGCGIAPTALEHVFDPFFTTKDVGAGTGLALASAYGTVRQSGGTIDVESELGRGSTFTMLLPAAVPTDGERALVVAGDPAAREAAFEALTEARFRVLTARSAGEAMRIAERLDGAIDLLVTGDIAHGDALRDALAAQSPGLRALPLREAVSSAIPGSG